MSRPKSNTVEYFPHMAQHGSTMAIIEGKFGNDGYAFWFKLLELLSQTENHFIDLKIIERWEFLQVKTRLDEITTSKMLDLLAKLQAIDTELWENDKIVWSQNLVENLKMVYANRKREVPQKPVSTNSYPAIDGISTSRNPTATIVSTQKNPRSKVKESIVKKSTKTLCAFSKNEKRRSLFEDLWRTYPIKREKQKAYKIFCELKLENGTFEKILNNLKQQIEFKTECDLSDKFCPAFPYLQRWLKNKRWEDSLPETETQIQEKRQSEIEKIKREELPNFENN